MFLLLVILQLYMHSGYSKITPQCNYKNSTPPIPYSLKELCSLLLASYFVSGPHSPTQFIVTFPFRVLPADFPLGGMMRISLPFSPAPRHTYHFHPPVSQHSHMITVVIDIVHSREMWKVMITFPSFPVCIFP